MYLRLILLMGLVSFFADWLYESTRAVTPQFLEQLGASAFVVGLAFGVGDALGYAARVLTGALADKRGGYWMETSLGYGLQVAAVAGLIFAPSYIAVVFLVFLERFSKALRTPSRDVIVASAGGDSFRGRAFGIHASLDQIGAVLGVFMATYMLYIGLTPRDVYTMALVPGLAALLVLYIAYRQRTPLSPIRRVGGVKFRREIAVFGVSQFLLGLSLVHISLFMYRLSETAWLASLLYLVAMVAEIPASLLWGALYDRDAKILLIAPPLSIALAICFTHGGLLYFFSAAVIYSFIMAYADVAAKAYASRLGGASSLGYVGAMWGFGLAIGGVLYGYLWDVNALDLVVLLPVIFASSAVFMIWKTINTS
ncbi:MAG: MFS transporter [Pyrobaculum sp.]